MMATTGSAKTAYLNNKSWIDPTGHTDPRPKPKAASESKTFPRVSL
jgi:hypothetical protein